MTKERIALTALALLLGSVTGGLDANAAPPLDEPGRQPRPVRAFGPVRRPVA
jgi:hypothetical protein